MSLVAVTSRSLLGLAPETGEVLWKHQHTEGDRRAFGSAQPVPVSEGGILLIDGRESALFQVSKNAEGYTVEEAWRSRALRGQGNFAVPVPYEGHLYGYSGNFLTCVDAATGKTVWKSRPPGEGELVLIDGHLVILTRVRRDRGRRRRRRKSTWRWRGSRPWIAATTRGRALPAAKSTCEI